MNQRWRGGRDSYRPPDEPINPREYRVEYLPGNREAKAFVLAHHYAGSYPVARVRFGLYHRRKMRLQGVAVFSVPVQPAVLTNVFPGVEIPALLELGRFVLLDEVPGNAESWFLGKCFHRLRRDGFVGVLAHSDPVRRTRADGTVVCPGHIGTVYQAFSGVYLGTTRPRVELVAPDGTVVSDRAINKIRAKTQGWRYAAALVERAGELARVHHPGKHRYCWGLNRRGRGLLPPSLDYPKRGPFDAESERPDPA